MKECLLVISSVMMFFFVLVGISQAGQCVFYGQAEDFYFYYNSSSVRYSGNIVSFEDYDNSACEETITTNVCEIDCAKRMYRSDDWDGWTEWKPIISGPIEAARIKLCR